MTLGYTLDEWLKTVEVEDSTRDGYIGYVERPANSLLPRSTIRTGEWSSLSRSAAGHASRSLGVPIVLAVLAGSSASAALTPASAVLETAYAAEFRHVLLARLTIVN